MVERRKGHHSRKMGCCIIHMKHREEGTAQLPEGRAGWLLPCQAHCSCSLSASTVIWGPAPAGPVCMLLIFVLWGWWAESLIAAYEFPCNIKPFLKGCKRAGLLRKKLVNVYCSVFLLLLFWTNIFVIITSFFVTFLNNISHGKGP